jgi:hypothetical protein
MKRLAVIGLACLISACQSDLVGLLPDKPDKVADFPATTSADLSGCVYQAAQSMTPPYAFHLNARADNREFVITPAGVSAKNVHSGVAKLELHFMTKGENTTVEMRESPIADHVLSRRIWSFVERCAEQVANPPGAKSAAP